MRARVAAEKAALTRPSVTGEMNEAGSRGVFERLHDVQMADGLDDAQREDAYQGVLDQAMGRLEELQLADASTAANELVVDAPGSFGQWEGSRDL